MKKKFAFTLIELLIVVAIIAILAAIAVPNFLEAAVRSRVSRVKADMRTISVGINAYMVDNNKVPVGRTGTGTYYPDWAFTSWLKCPITKYIGGCGYLLTTPIAYLAAIPSDPFNVGASRDYRTGTLYSFVYFGSVGSWECGGRDPETLESIKFRWYLISPGPDLTYWNITGSWYYDPTNGTVSGGDIWCFDKDGLRGGGGR